MSAMEHDDALAAARAHLESKEDPAAPLMALPDGFATTRESMHLVAERLLKPKREAETGTEIALRFTRGGFGTPAWDEGGSARVEGVDLVLSTGGSEHRVPAGDLRAGAELLGVDPPQPDRVPIEAAAAAALADWFAFGTVFLAELIAAYPDLDPEPIRLWPEHFDVATVLGNEVTGGRANHGASPGDADHGEPYLYVGPWDQSLKGEVWNATAFVGAELLYDEIVASHDQLAVALSFASARVRALA